LPHPTLRFSKDAVLNMALKSSFFLSFCDLAAAASVFCCPNYFLEKSITCTR
jgi:hypothetical protein